MSQAGDQKYGNGKGGKSGPPLAEQAYQQIKRMLLVRELVPSQKLRYQDIAKKLEMSQTPVILALTRLENEGLVESQANKGFFVPELHLDELHELYDMRVVVEAFLVGKVAETITEAQLAELAELMRQHQSYRSESYTIQRLWCDARLHLALASFSGHQVGQGFLRQLFDRIYLRYRPESLSTWRMQESEEDHDRLFEALEAHDPDLAVELLTQHIERGRSHLLDGMERHSRSREAIMPWDEQDV